MISACLHVSCLHNSAVAVAVAVIAAAVTAAITAAVITLPTAVVTAVHTAAAKVTSEPENTRVSRNH